MEIPPDTWNLNSVSMYDGSRCYNNLLVMHLDVGIWHTHCINILSFLSSGQYLNIT